MPKINVYVPDALAAAIKDAGISVSPVCQRALEDEVRKVNATRALKRYEASVRAAARRLDAALEQETHDLEERGGEHGRQWAFETATIRELELVDGMMRADSSTNREHLDVDARVCPTLFRELENLGYAGIDGTIMLFPGTYADPFMMGFLRAAAEAWQAIAAEMDRAADA